MPTPLPQHPFLQCAQGMEEAAIAYCRCSSEPVKGVLKENVLQQKEAGCGSDSEGREAKPKGLFLESGCAG